MEGYVVDPFMARAYGDGAAYFAQWFFSERRGAGLRVGWLVIDAAPVISFHGGSVLLVIRGQKKTDFRVHLVERVVR